MNDGTFRQLEGSGERASQRARRLRIVALNDLARSAMGVASTLVQTPGIEALPLEVQSCIRERVETFSDFTPDNDPYGEHDFGAFELDVSPDRYRVFWKIDYYDRSYEYASPDESDPSVTRRVLTIMLPSEY